MKNVVEQTKVVRIGELAAAKAFQIKFTPEVAQHLSSGVYSDKILAILRELGCNAFDAHVDAGHPDKPWELHLPTGLEKWCSFRDFGPGLTMEDVFNVFIHYFESTKNTSNDYVGCIGIGAKSPFAYVDQFAVISYLDGTAYHYLMHKDEQGIPCCQPLKEVETDEPNGLYIRVDVKAGDVAEFSRKAEIVYSRFKTQPKMTGAQTSIPVVTYTMRENDWGFRGGREDYNTRGAYAIMGNIGYPLKPSDVNGDDYNQAMRSLLNTNIDIFFDIGDLDVALSREHLSYTPRALENIRKRLAGICKDMAQVVSDKFANAKTLYEARCLAYDLLNDTNAPLYRLTSIIDLKNVEWKGQSVERASVSLANGEGRVTRLSKGSRYVYGQGSVATVSTMRDCSISCSEKWPIYEQDKKKGGFSRADWNIREGHLKQCYLVRFEDDNERKAFLKKMGGDASLIKSLDELEEKPSVKNQRAGKGVPRTVCTLNMGQQFSRLSSYWKPDKVDFTSESGYYVKMKRERFIYDGDEKHPQELSQMLNHLKALGHDIKKLVGVKKSQLKNVTSKWVLLDDLIVQIKDKLSKDKLQAIRIEKAKQVANVGNENLVKMFVKHKHAIKSTVLHKWFDMYLDYTQAREYIHGQNNALLPALRYFDIHLPAATVDNLTDFREMLNSNYPILEHVDFFPRWGREPAKEAIEAAVEYINLLDK